MKVLIKVNIIFNTEFTGTCIARGLAALSAQAITVNVENEPTNASAFYILTIDQLMGVKHNEILSGLRQFVYALESHTSGGMFTVQLRLTASCIMQCNQISTI